jgi:hypothetical protein
MKNRDKYLRQLKTISIKEAIRMVFNRIPKESKEKPKDKAK